MTTTPSGFSDAVAHIRIDMLERDINDLRQRLDAIPT